MTDSERERESESVDIRAQCLDWTQKVRGRKEEGRINQRGNAVRRK